MKQSEPAFARKSKRMSPIGGGYLNAIFHSRFRSDLGICAAYIQITRRTKLWAPSRRRHALDTLRISQAGSILRSVVAKNHCCPRASAVSPTLMRAHPSRFQNERVRYRSEPRFTYFNSQSTLLRSSTTPRNCGSRRTTPTSKSAGNTVNVTRSIKLPTMESELT